MARNSGVTEDFGNQDRTTLDLVIPDTEDGETFPFDATITEINSGSTASESVMGTGTYNHPSISITVEGETNRGTVSADGDTIRLETEPGDFATLTRD